MKTLTIDPVCGTEVGSSSCFHAEHQGMTYLFCGEKCRVRFQHDPGEFICPEDGEWEALVQNLEVRLHEPERADRRSSDYVPLFLVPGLALLLACSRQISSSGPWDGAACIRDFTGFFLIFLAAFALCEWKAFADAFQTYDFLGRLFRPYAWLYPLLQLALGLSFLTGRDLTLVSAATAGLMTFSALGMLAALRGGYAVDYVNPVAPLNLPLSAAALVATLSAAAMSIVICWLDRL